MIIVGVMVALLCVLFVLGVLDIFGKTRTGCGDLLNSIRINGWGLGTHIAVRLLAVKDVFSKRGE